MELLNIHINDFGKLHDVDFDFHSGLNSFTYENGWGKTTLSVFIKAMFYGMEHTSSKDLNKNEKQKYFPWQGGIYGGSLSFSNNNKKYRVSRTFSLKKNEDTFELIDLLTNKKSTDYSQELGIEIFGVNRETYNRSLHIILSETPEGSSDISAKLNNLIESGDIGNFDNALEILDKKATLLKAKKGKNGKIEQLKQQIVEDREAIDNINSRIKQNEELENKISEIRNTLHTLKKEQDSLTKGLSENAKYESKLHYEQLKKDLDDSIKLKKKYEEFFNGQIPDASILKAIDNISNEYTTVTSNIKNNSTSQSDKDKYEQLKEYFKGDLPTQDEINSCIKTNNSFVAFKEKENELKLSESEKNDFETLKSIFENKNVSEETINNYISAISVVQKQNEEIVKQDTLLQQKQNELKIAQLSKPKNTKRIVLFSIGAIFGIIAVVLFLILTNIVISCVSMSLCIILFLLGIFLKEKKVDYSPFTNEISKLSSFIENLKNKKDETENEYKQFINSFNYNYDSEISALNKISLDFNKYSTLKLKFETYSNWLNTMTMSKEDYENVLKTFMKRYCKSSDINSITSDIQSLNEKLNKLFELEKKINNDSINNQIFIEKKSKLDSILSQYKTEKVLSYAEQVQEIHKKLNEINTINTQIQANEQKLKVFENTIHDDLSVFDTLQKPEKNIDELQNEMNIVTDKINSENKTLTDYQKIVDNNIAYTEKKDDIETEIEAKIYEKDECLSQYNILQKTMEMLSKAKENLDANYSDPMKKAFNKYVALLNGKIKLMIDTDLKVSIDEKGQTHDSDYLSDGYKDITNFCSRMALIDSLFKEINPPIILDDPFVNLDNDKVNNALELIKDIEKEKQIIYFTCHSSRGLK